MGKFFSAVGGFLKKFFTSTSSTQQLSSTITLAAPAVEEIAQLVKGDAGSAEATNIIGEIQGDVGALATLISQSHSSGITPSVATQATAIMGSLKANMSTLLTAGHIKNAETLSKVQGIATVFLNEIQAILTVVSGSGNTSTSGQ